MEAANIINRGITENNIRGPAEDIQGNRVKLVQKKDSDDISPKNTMNGKFPNQIPAVESSETPTTKVSAEAPTTRIPVQVAREISTGNLPDEEHLPSKDATEKILDDINHSDESFSDTPTTKVSMEVSSKTSTERISDEVPSEAPTTKLSTESYIKSKETSQEASLEKNVSPQNISSSQPPFSQSQIPFAQEMSQRETNREEELTGRMSIAPDKDLRKGTTKKAPTGSYDQQNSGFKVKKSAASTLAIRFVPPEKNESSDTILREYRLLEKIGSGAMGSVYKAEQMRLGRIVAIKMLSKELCKDDFYVKRFMIEMHSAAQLNHPNIVQIYDAGEQDGQLFYAMEYVKGESVGLMLERMNKLPLSNALTIISHIANALTQTYEAGIVHRDIKPENILVTTKGMAKLADLGLAKNVDYAKEMEAIEDGLMMGTPYYVAPEQIIAASSVDYRADIYSLGATFYAMITGVIPFYHRSSRVILMQVLRQTIPSAKEVDTNIPDSISDVIAKMMQKNPDNRFQIPQELVEALEEIQKNCKLP